MSDQPIVRDRGTSTIVDPESFNMGREPSRQSSRAPTRFIAPEPYEKFTLSEDEIPEGMDAFWLPTKILGQPSREVMQYYQAGWEPARAQDFPRISGYGVEYPKALLDAKLIETISAESPIIIDDLMLVMRAKTVSRAAHQRRIHDAVDQVQNQMRRLQSAYRHRGGDLGIRRNKFEQLPNTAPQQDADEE